MTTEVETAIEAEKLYIETTIEGAAVFLAAAHNRIDALYGADYCKRNPEFRARLVAAFIAACVALEKARQ